MTVASFTPAQQALYDVLVSADAAHVTIARQMAQAFLSNPNTSQRPEDYSAPTGTSAWDVIEEAVETFDRDTGHLKERLMAVAFLQVVDAVLTTGRT